MRSRAVAAGWPGFVGHLGLLLVLAVAAGCGPARGKVSGRVLLHGTPLPGGEVNFRPADSRQHPVSAQIDEEGHYEAVLPVGEVMVSIDNRGLLPRPKANLGAGLTAGLPLPAELRKKPDGAGPEPERTGSAQADSPRPPGHYVPIADKYYHMETSSLQFAVTGGDQEHDFELTD
jgi:hypothetical protein